MGKTICIILSVFLVTGPVLATSVISPRLENQAHTYFQLDNGIRVILISDEHSRESSIMLTVQAGVHDDPADVPGLSHLLEHVLLYDESGRRQSLDDCAKTNTASRQGYRNYFTTQYAFRVAHRSLEKILPCISQTLEEPRFASASILRETAAIEAEYEHRWGTPAHYDKAALQFAASQSHPWRRQFIGNQAAFGSDVDLLRNRLITQFRATYTPARLSIVLQSDRSVKVVKNLLQRYFGDLHSGKVKQPVPVPLFAANELPRLVRYVPSDHRDRLTLAFPYAHADHQYKKKVAEYLRARLQDRQPGSLTHYLQAKGLITHLEVSAGPVDATTGLLAVTFDLTNKGLTKVSMIGDAYFSFIHSLRQDGANEQFFSEMQRFASLTFDFRTTDTTYLREVGRNLLRYSPVDAARVAFAWDEFRHQDIVTFLDSQRPDNLLIAHSVADLSGPACSPWLPNRCISANVPEAWLKTWQSPSLTDDFGVPSANAFLVDDVEVLEGNSMADLVSDDGAIDARVVIHPASGKATAYVRVLYPQACNSPRNILFTRVLSELLRDAVYDTVPEARTVGYRAQVKIGDDGIEIITRGYPGKLPEFTEATVAALLNLETTANVFSAHRRYVVERDSKAGKLGPQLMVRVMASGCNGPAGDSGDFSGFTQWLDDLRNSIQLQALFHGNLSRSDARRLLGLLSAYDASPSRAISIDKANSPSDVKVLTADNKVIIAIPVDNQSIGTIARFRVLEPIVDNIVRNTFRQRKLGYVGQAILRNVDGIPVIFILAESPHVSGDELVRDIKGGLQRYRGQVGRIGNSALKQLKVKVMRRAQLSQSDWLWQSFKASLATPMSEQIHAVSKVRVHDVAAAYNDLVDKLVEI